MGSINREPKDETRKLLGLGLTSTSPYYISDTALHTFDKSATYVLYVLEDVILHANTIHNVTGNDIIGVVLGPGYYHFACKQVQLVSGAMIVYLTN